LIRRDYEAAEGKGRRLMEKAEQIAAQEFGLPRMAVITSKFLSRKIPRSGIAGVGVREYYRRLGYALEDTYMVKRI